MTDKDSAHDPRCRTNRWGIDLAYEDALGRWHKTSKRTEDALLASMSLDLEDTDPKTPQSQKIPPCIIIRQGETGRLPSPGTVLLESGETRGVGCGLPLDLPLGYHHLQLDNASQSISLIVAPPHCWLPADLNMWGWSVQLYAARSRESWGIGDFNDLYRLAHWSAKSQGAGMMLLNPLGAVTPLCPVQCSPYYPSSRLFLSPLWLHVPSLPGVGDLGAEYGLLARQGRTCNADRLIDRDRIFTLKMQALEMLWPRFRGDEAFDAFCASRAEALESFATFCVLAEQHGSGWHTWPSEFRHPGSAAVTQFRQAHAGRIRFHKWTQWLLDQQLAQSSGLLALMQDLPIGVDPDGADAWAWQEILAQGVGVGAPPDEFNTQGQDWGLPPFAPYRLRAAAYEPFIQTIRAAFRHCRGLRIDHVMGLFRLFWIPNGMTAAEGAYVRYNEDEMLAIVALESVRAQAFVVGEDLGTVEDSAREKLARSHILSYRLLWFEKEDPESYPQDSLAAVTTHDLPTIAGLWNGTDLARQRELGLKPNDAGVAEIQARLAAWTRLEKPCDIEDVVAGTYQVLASASSRVLTACLDDVLAVEERPNIPATNQEQNPNWSIALPSPIEDIMQSPLADQIADSLHSRRPRSLPQPGTPAAGNLSNEPLEISSTVWD